MLEVSLSRVGTVLHLETDAWSTVKLSRQATNEYAPTRRIFRHVSVREAMVRVLHQERPGRAGRRLVLRHLLDVCGSARRVGHHSIAQVRLSVLHWNDA